MRALVPEIARREPNCKARGKNGGKTGGRVNILSSNN